MGGIGAHVLGFSNRQMKAPVGNLLSGWNNSGLNLIPARKFAGYLSCEHCAQIGEESHWATAKGLASHTELVHA